MWEGQPASQPSPTTCRSCLPNEPTSTACSPYQPIVSTRRHAEKPFPYLTVFNWGLPKMAFRCIWGPFRPSLSLLSRCQPWDVRLLFHNRGVSAKQHRKTVPQQPNTASGCAWAVVGREHKALGGLPAPPRARVNSVCTNQCTCTCKSNEGATEKDRKLRSHLASSTVDARANGARLSNGPASHTPFSADALVAFDVSWLA